MTITKYTSNCNCSKPSEDPSIHVPKHPWGSVSILLCLSSCRLGSTGFLSFSLLVLTSFFPYILPSRPSTSISMAGFPLLVLPSVAGVCPPLISLVFPLSGSFDLFWRAVLSPRLRCNYSHASTFSVLLLTSLEAFPRVVQTSVPRAFPNIAQAVQWNFY